MDTLSDKLTPHMSDNSLGILNGTPIQNCYNNDMYVLSKFGIPSCISSIRERPLDIRGEGGGDFVQNIFSVTLRARIYFFNLPWARNLFSSHCGPEYCFIQYKLGSIFYIRFCLCIYVHKVFF